MSSIEEQLLLLATREDVATAQQQSGMDAALAVGDFAVVKKKNKGAIDATVAVQAHRMFYSTWRGRNKGDLKNMLGK